tara:strand:- start:119 stop:805 length:687 start_codon:yes stop_codon:yes gene_type:complete
MMPLIRSCSLAAVLHLALLSGSSVGQEDALPRVLLLGDVIYNGPAREAAKELKEKVEVVYRQLPPGQPFSTANVLFHIDEFLGDEEWDLIFFNVGLGDLTYRVPRLKVYRVLSRNAGGVRTASKDEYRSNLARLLKRLKQTDAQLVWASTTPIRSSSTQIFEPGSEVAYNQIARELMESEGVAICDMHAKVSDLINLERPSSFDPFDFEKKPIHPFIVKALLEHLQLD